MASRVKKLEKLIRTAVQTFAPQSNGCMANGLPVKEDFQLLRQLVAEIDPVEDLGFPRNIGQPLSRSVPVSTLFKTSSSSVAPASYMEIFENKSVSIGIFVLKEGTSIPLHDHLGMHGILRVLYGRLRLQAYSPVEHPANRSSLMAQKHPEVVLTESDHPCFLTPLERNFHQISALDGPVSFLDILAPPYNPEEGQERDCFYYKDTGGEGDLRALSRIPCPSSFWCSSIKYTGPNLQHLHAELLL